MSIEILDRLKRKRDIYVKKRNTQPKYGFHVDPRFRMMYYLISHKSLFLGIRTSLYFIPRHRKYRRQHNQCDTRAVQDGKDGLGLGLLRLTFIPIGCSFLGMV